MMSRAAQQISRLNWIMLMILALVLTGCFQSAGGDVAPSPVNLTALAPLRETPFITPLGPGGFVPPTDDPNRFLTPTPEPPAQQLPTAQVPPTQPVVVPPTQPVVVPPTDSAANPAPTIPPTNAVLPTPTALPVGNTNPCIHIVQPGEWFYAIARKYNISPQDLLAANPRRNVDALAPGDQLRIPNCNPPTATPIPPTATVTPPSLLPGAPVAPQPIQPTLPPATNIPTPIPLSGRTYIVAEGDTLGAIARKFGTTVQALREANGLTTDFLRVGQVLQIPK